MSARFGQEYGGPFMTEAGTLVVMRRKGQRVRFFAESGEQVGPEHSNVVPAVVWAYAQGWHDPSDPAWAPVIRAEIQAGRC